MKGSLGVRAAAGLATAVRNRLERMEYRTGPIGGYLTSTDQILITEGAWTGGDTLPAESAPLGAGDGTGRVTIERIDLVVPADLVAGLRIPALAITNGAADPEWADVPLGRWRWQRSPSQRLPLDPRTARSVRRCARLAPWSMLVNLVALAAWFAVAFGGLSRSGTLAALAVGGSGILWSLVQQRGLPRHPPYRSRSGDLRIPEVPTEVAHRWVAQNPGVVATGEPAPRPHSRRFYATWALVLLPASIVLAVVLANNGREDFVLLWMLVPALFVTAVSMALKTQPPAKPGTGQTWPPGAA